MNFIAEAREAISSYNVIGGVAICEMQSILAVLIGPKSTPELTGKLAAIGVRKLVEMTISELQEFGLSKLQAQNVHSGCLMAKALKQSERREVVCTIRSPKDAAMYLMDELSGMNQEHFGALYLNIKNQVIHKETHFIGTLNSSIAHPRDVFRTAVKHSAASIILFHCHPSGVCAESPEDLAVTRRCVDAGSICGVEVIDHIIVGDKNYLSMNERGLVSFNN